MECAMVSCLPEGSDRVYEVKYDGYRAVGGRASGEPDLYSRNHKNFNKRFPQIADALGVYPATTQGARLRSRCYNVPSPRKGRAPQPCSHPWTFSSKRKMEHTCGRRQRKILSLRNQRSC